VPKVGWQAPVQYSAALPQNPYSEQQFPKSLPWHVCPVVPPQAPLSETLSVEVGRGAVPVTVAVEPAHVPKGFWQPAPQWPVEEPQYPYAFVTSVLLRIKFGMHLREQQSP